MPNIDDVLRRQEQIIDTIGWAVTHVLPTDDDPDTTTPFAYTVGLTAHHYPELLTAGLPPRSPTACSMTSPAGSMTGLNGSATASASATSSPATTRSSSTGHPPMTCCPGWRSRATAVTRSASSSSSGPTSRAGSPGTAGTTSNRRHSH